VRAASDAARVAGARRYKPYPAYKDSGVEWLGEIPAGWEVKPLKALMSRNDAGVWGEDFDDEGVIVLRSTEQTVDGKWKIDDPARRKLSIREASAARLALGDLVVTKSSGSELHIGKTSIVDERVAGLGCCFSNFMQRLRMAPPNTPQLHWYLLNCPVAREQLVFLSSTTTGLGNLNGSILGAIRVPVATQSEQRAIAAFLDRETARIDALVAKKERLIALLQEQRTALITRAVTKGLDPTVPMKDSGVEWLGEIPAHWDLVPSTWLLTESKQRALDGDEQLSATQKYGVIPQAEFERLEGRQVVHAFMHLDQRKHVEVDDFVMSMRSFEGGLERVRARGCVRSSYGVLRAASGVHVGFFSHLLKSSAYIQSLRATSNFIRDGQDLSFRNFRLVKLPSIPTGEQRAIAAFLDRETARIDALVAKVRDAIERLKELRTALISAAVTGKIDVREEVAA
jgi:type I restriction enzyme S subunit